MSDLFTDTGNRAGIYEVCEWWQARYPADVFPYTPAGLPILSAEGKQNHVVAIIRHEMEAIVEAGDHSIAHKD